MDAFADYPTTLNAPARDATAVTPSDSADLAPVPRALYVGQAGTIRLVMIGGQTVTLDGVAAGSILPLRPQRILQTGTTAGAIIALW